MIQNFRYYLWHVHILQMRKLRFLWLVTGIKSGES